MGVDRDGASKGQFVIDRKFNHLFFGKGECPCSVRRVCMVWLFVCFQVIDLLFSFALFLVSFSFVYLDYFLFLLSCWPILRDTIAQGRFSFHSLILRTHLDVRRMNFGYCVNRYTCFCIFHLQLWEINLHSKIVGFENAGIRSLILAQS